MLFVRCALRGQKQWILDKAERGQKNRRMKFSLKLSSGMVVFVALAACCGSVFGADISGKWKAEFDTQIGHLKYTYELKAEREKLTGKAFRELDGTKTTIEIVEGKIKSEEVSFVEPLKVQEQEVRIEYKGKLSGDEIKFVRKVGDFGTTEIVAKREKEEKEKEKEKEKAEKKASSADSK